MPDGRITVFLADDNILVREGVRALISREEDIEVVGVAEDFDGLIAGAEETAPMVLVTDIRMPPSFQSEGIDAAKLVRKRHPGTGVVILSQYDDPGYAVSLLAEGAEGYAYLLKDRLAEADMLVKAVRAVAGGSSVLDPKIVEALVSPVSSDDLSAGEEEILRLIAEGKPIKVIAAARGLTPEAVANDIEALFLKLAQGASAGAAGALRRLKMLHEAIARRDEVEETLGLLLPTGLAEQVRAKGARIGETELLTVTAFMSDVRGYSRLAERTEPSVLARQLNQHRALLNEAIIAQGGTVMQFTGDGVFAVFGAPLPQADHADRALAAATQIHLRQAELNTQWEADGFAPFLLGIGLCTGEVAAALLGSEERLEYTLVGDTVNLSARLQDLARPGGAIVLGGSTYSSLQAECDAAPLGEILVKGRDTPVTAYRIDVVPVASEASGG